MNKQPEYNGKSDDWIRERLAEWTTYLHRARTGSEWWHECLGCIESLAAETQARGIA